MNGMGTPAFCAGFWFRDNNSHIITAREDFLAIKTFEINYETIHIDITSLCWSHYLPSAIFAYKI